MFLTIEGKTFIERIYDNASYCFDEIFISTDSESHANEIKKLIPNARIIVDLYKEVGPIGGLCSVYKETKADGFAVTAVDMPYMVPKVLLHLKDECQKGALILKNGTKLEPLYAYYAESALKLFETAINEKQYSIIKALDGNYDTILVEQMIEKYSDVSMETIEKAVRNINTREDYEEINEISSYTSGS